MSSKSCILSFSGKGEPSKDQQQTLILLGATFILLGTAVYLSTNESIRESIKGFINRKKAKRFVRRHLNGSESMMKAVDHLSDTELNTLVKLADKANTAKEQVGQTLEDLVDKVKDTSVNVTDKMKHFF